MKNKHLNRLWALVLTLAMVTLWLPGASAQETLEDLGFEATGLPIVEKTVTLRGMAKQGVNVANFNDMKFFNDMGELTQVKVEWEMVPQAAWNDKISLFFSTGTGLPDIIYGNNCLTADQVVRYGNQGFFVDMKPFIEPYGEHLKKLEQEITNLFNTATTPNGAIYALPSVHGIMSNSNCAMFLNKKWMDKLNLEVPTTTDELLDVLRAFKNGGDLNGNGIEDEIPFSMKVGDSVNGYNPLFGAFGRVDNNNHLLVEDGKVIFTAMIDEYKEAVKWFATMSSEGLLDKESFTQDTSVLWAKIQNDPAQVGCATFWTASWAAGTDDYEKASEYWVPVPALVGPNGAQQWEKFDTSVFGLASFLITKDCKYPEIAFRWGDYQYSYEAARDSNFGPLDVTHKRNEDGSYSLLETVNGEPNTGDVRRKYSPLNYGIFANPPSLWEKEYAEFGATEYEKNTILNKELYGPYQVDNYYPLMYQTDVEIETLTLMKTELNSYVSEMTSKWMLRGGADEEWDHYLEQLNKMGLEEYLQLYQASYDRWANSN